MEKRHVLPLFLSVFCLLWLRACSGTSYSYTYHYCGPPFVETMPLVIRPRLFAVNNIAWSPDSKRIASASLDKTVLIYDVANQKNLLIYRGHTAAMPS